MILGSLLFLSALLAAGFLLVLVRWLLFKPGPDTPRPNDPAARRREQLEREAADRAFWHIKAHGRPPKS